MIRYAASAGSPCCISRLPGSKPTRSLINASSFNFDGSISAKMGTRRSSSNSCLRLIFFLPSCGSVFSFPHDQHGHPLCVFFERGLTSLLFRFPIAEDDDVAEISQQTRPIQHPNDTPVRQILSLDRCLSQKIVRHRLSDEEWSLARQEKRKTKERGSRWGSGEEIAVARG